MARHTIQIEALSAEKRQRRYNFTFSIKGTPSESETYLGIAQIPGVSEISLEKPNSVCVTVSDPDFRWEGFDEQVILLLEKAGQAITGEHVEVHEEIFFDYVRHHGSVAA